MESNNQNHLKQLERTIGHLKLVLSSLEELASSMASDLLPSLPEPTLEPKPKPKIPKDDDQTQEFHLAPIPAHKIKLEELLEAGVIKTPITLHSVVERFPVQATLRQDGRIIYAGETFKTLSAAARKATEGAWIRANGWEFWGVYVSGVLTILSRVRSNYAHSLRRPSSPNRWEEDR